jgi:hypothetical protein
MNEKWWSVRAWPLSAFGKGIRFRLVDCITKSMGSDSSVANKTILAPKIQGIHISRYHIECYLFILRDHVVVHSQCLSYTLCASLPLFPLLFCLQLFRPNQTTCFIEFGSGHKKNQVKKLWPSLTQSIGR